MKVANADAKVTANESKYDSVNLEYQGLDRNKKGYDIEAIKQRQHNLIIENGSIEAVNERKNWHKADNRNFKNFIDIKHKQKYTPSIKANLN